jgi:hypothetical protein
MDTIDHIITGITEEIIGVVTTIDLDHKLLEEKPQEDLTDRTIPTDLLQPERSLLPTMVALGQLLQILRENLIDIHLHLPLLPLLREIQTKITKVVLVDPIIIQRLHLLLRQTATIEVEQDDSKTLFIFKYDTHEKNNFFATDYIINSRSSTI